MTCPYLEIWMPYFFQNDLYMLNLVTFIKDSWLFNKHTLSLSLNFVDQTFLCDEFHWIVKGWRIYWVIIQSLSFIIPFLYSKLQLKVVRIEVKGDHRILTVYDRNKTFTTLAFWQPELYIVEQMEANKVVFYWKNQNNDILVVQVW